MRHSRSPVEEHMFAQTFHTCTQQNITLISWEDGVLCWVNSAKKMYVDVKMLCATDELLHLKKIEKK